MGKATRALHVVYIICNLLVHVAFGNSSHKRLYDELFVKRGYNRLIRPVYDESTTTLVEMQFFLSQVLDMDETKETLTTNAWLTLRWKDEYLEWNPAEFNGTQNIKLTSNIVWLPDLYLYDNAASKYDELWGDQIVSIKYDGTVMWAAPAIIKTHCKLDVTHFPFDEQTCIVLFGPWQHSAEEILVVGRTTASYFQGNAEWSLINISASDNTEKFAIYSDDDEVPYCTVAFTMVLRRQPLYYIFNLILPCGFISVTTLLSFFLPPDSGEKVGLGITVLLSLTVFLLLVAEILPPASSVPVIGQYYAATMVLVSLSLAMTVTVLSLHHRGPESSEVPRWVRKVILGHLARVLLLRKLTSPNTDTGKPVTTSNSISRHCSCQESAATQPLLDLKISSPMADSLESNTNVNTAKRNKRHKSGNNITVNINDEHLKLLKRIHQEMKHVSGHFKDTTKEANKRCEWKQVAMVVDRLFMFVYIMGSVSTCLIIICQVFVS
ncbi:neuronal acetylcholine receptor subunit alpha-9-like [Ptychodera flava]|uniref:neuronal acetylcholine receptor subunit alpha-9-like n=1 Tax=Ptychodera flava TaxID=63121 RepID=UPI00396A7D15